MILLKTAMREAFEAIPIPTEESPLFKRIMNSLKGNAGVIPRQQMWHVIRNKKK